jgi:hypothetical protein
VLLKLNEWHRRWSSTLRLQAKIAELTALEASCGRGAVGGGGGSKTNSSSSRISPVAPVLRLFNGHR